MLWLLLWRLTQPTLAGSDGAAQVTFGLDRLGKVVYRPQAAFWNCNLYTGLPAFASTYGQGYKM